ncbi:MAG: tol-pal system protein YbgF [Acidobacteriota bacterium]|nr:tol-pal system protein YbgF [Acidobacteriota bacterium]
MKHLTIALGSLLILGCSGQFLSGGTGDLELDLAELECKVAELDRQRTMDQVEIERLRLKVAQLESARPESRSGPGADAAEAARGLDEEVVAPPRQVEIIEVADLEEPLEEASSALAREVTAAAQVLYDRGYSLYHQGRHLQAEETFARFLVEYSETDLGDNAQYWIGECRLARQDNPGALEAFRQTVRRYPDGNKTPEALLKIGVALERQGDDEGARTSFLEVQQRFPDTPASDRATERLNSL